MFLVCVFILFLLVVFLVMDFCKWCFEYLGGLLFIFFRVMVVMVVLDDLFLFVILIVREWEGVVL